MEFLRLFSKVHAWYQLLCCHLSACRPLQSRLALDTQKISFVCKLYSDISDQIPGHFMISSLTRWPCSPSSLLAFAAVGSPLLIGHLPFRLPPHFVHPPSSCSYLVLQWVLHMRLPPQFVHHALHGRVLHQHIAVLYFCVTCVMINTLQMAEMI